jgi:hypothetical protein
LIRPSFRVPLAEGDACERLEVPLYFFGPGLILPDMTKLSLRVMLLSCLLSSASCQPFFVMHHVATTTDQPPPEPAKSFRVSQFVFHTDIDLKKEHVLLSDLEKLSEQVFTELALPHSTTLIQVYVFENVDRFRGYMNWKDPTLPDRRAFFIEPQAGSEEGLIVYTYWSDRATEDLRHELTHALLHSVLKVVPLWLDEGLAEYFQLPPERKGLNFTYLNLLRNKTDPFVPNLPRLEGLTQIQQMTPPEYRESWAWVHFMLRSSPEARKVFLDYVHSMRTTAEPGLLHGRLTAAITSPEEAFLKHLEKLDTGKPVNEPAEKHR